jgi:putative glutamine amidotransferase
VKSKRPLIGISASEIRQSQMIRQIQEGEPPGHEIALGLNYVRAVTDAGGLGIVLPPSDRDLVPGLLERIDGLCLSGGPDIDPSVYGAEPHSCLGPADSDLDRFEIELARGAVERDLPLLAICRGMQVLNVSRGGTLFQHLPDLSSSSLDHRQDMPGDHPGHRVELDPSSRMAASLDQSVLEVNTFHHQGVDSVGRDLVPAGWADDGLVEAVEITGQRFALGVQWHAELMGDARAGLPLFSQLVESAQEYGQDQDAHQ